MTESFIFKNIPSKFYFFKIPYKDVIPIVFYLLLCNLSQKASFGEMIRVSHIGHSNFVYISLLYPNKVQFFLFPHKQKKKQWLRKRTHPKTHKIYITHAHTIQHLVFIPIILEISKIFTSSTLALFFS